MKKLLIAMGTSLLFSAAYAQGQSEEVAPITNTKPQIAAEARKNARPAGVVRKDEGTVATGQGSSLRKPNKSELAGESRAAAREARPHREPVQGGTPQ